MEQFRLPKITMPSLNLPQSIQEVLQEAEEKLAHRPKLLQLFKNCFPNTLETTTKLKRMERLLSSQETFQLVGYGIR